MGIVHIVCAIVAMLIVIGVGAYFSVAALGTRFSAEKKTYSFCSEQDFEHVRLEPTFLLKLHHLLYVSDKILTEANVRYCAIGGTLLSMERSGYLTPWDDDGDLAVFESDLNARRTKVDALLKEHKVHLTEPFSFFANLGVFHLRLDDDHPLNKRWPSDDQPFVDWMLFAPLAGRVDSKYREPIHHFARKGERDIFPKSYITERQMFPLRRQPLKVFSDKQEALLDPELAVENCTLWLVSPANNAPLLTREYGTAAEPEMWRTCYLASSHRSALLFVKPCRLTDAQIEKM